MANAHASQAADSAQADHAEHHGLAHIASKKTLLATGSTLLVLTLITVLATRVDFGSQMNLIVALAIATIKATLVAMYFMHLRYDKPFHTVAVATGLLFALLFVTFTFMDGNQYQADICADREYESPDCTIWQDKLDERAAKAAE